MMTTNITNMSLSDLEDLMIFLGEKKYRAKQLYEWLHTKNINSYQEITNLPANLITYLEENYSINTISIKDSQISNDRSKKYLFNLSDNEIVESVGIISNNGNKNRLTVCFSSQIGCPIKCKFCATGQEGFKRNLTSNEIIQQVAHIQKDLGMPVSNLVGMGQGEPFLNYENLINALRRFNQDKGFTIGARHITISTCGIIEGINKFSLEKEQFRLAISLHSVNQEKRNILMPAMKTQRLEELKTALQRYQDLTNRRITFEYMLLDNFNDTDEDLRRLISYCSELNVHVNLLKYNKVQFCDLIPAKKSKFNIWQKELLSHNIACSTRYSKGADISGACGQLKNSINKSIL